MTSMDDYFQIFSGGYCGIVGVWLLFEMFLSGRQNPMSIRIGLLVSSASFITFGVLSLLGGLGFAWVKPEVIGWSFVPCLLCAGFWWVSQKMIARRSHNKDA